MSSLLGKLLSSGGGTTSRSKNPLDSNLEDQFTHSLLFPDPASLCHNDQVFPLSTETVLTPAAITNFDINGEIDLEMRDVRVIIMQEATPATGLPTLLYDTHTPPPQSPPLDRQTSSNGSVYPPRSEGRRSISSARKPSVGQQTARPAVVQQEQTPKPLQRFGAFNRQPIPGPPETGITETDGQRSLREYKEEVTTFGNCIFGTSEVLAYKGTTCKMHLLKSSDNIPPFPPSSFSGDANSSFGRSSMRGSSKLAQSFTSDTFAQPPTSAGYISPNTVRGDRKKVLVTRMFPVSLPNDEEIEEDSASQTVTPTAGNVRPGESTGYPFPKVGGDTGAASKKVQPKQKRTPMYAVGLVIQLPSASHASMPTSRSSFRGPGSYNDQESCPSSFNSTRRAGWSIVHGFGVESLESSYSSDVDDRIELVTKHWDIIMRTLSHMQGVATAALLPLLRQADISSPVHRNSSSHVRTPSSSVSISGKRVVEDIKPFKVPKTNAKLVQLTAHCLMHVQLIHKEADITRQRILGGIKTSQVITGQGRWGIWREEARLVGKWAGSKDEGFFFFNLLTGFLGNHTEWLQALGPSWYRRRNLQRQKAHREDEICLPARTIIVSENKLMARRLIFLLSSFLPPNQQLGLPRHRPSTSASFGAYSQSPPNYAVPILREESLRRKINKKANVAKGVHSRTMSFPAEPAIPPPHIHQARRTSDATSIKTANLPIPGSHLGTRKSSAATTTTVTPITTMPHFSTRRPTRGTGPDPRPGSSGSLATEDLSRALKRGESSGQVSNDSIGGNSPWSRFSMSSIFSSKRRSSTATTSEFDPLSRDGSEITISKGENATSKLADMVQEATLYSSQASKGHQGRELRKSDGSATTAKPSAQQADNQTEEISEQTIHVLERKPNPEGAYESPIKTVINDDGVVDVDVTLPGELSFDTAVSSPSSSGYLSTPGFGNGLDGFEQYSRELDTSLNVGGWLHRYHPDFSLQAIPTQDGGLVEEVKASMRDEPTPILSSTPNPDNGHSDRWVDVCSAIIADTTNFSIKRIRYRRLIKPVAQATTTNLATDSRYGNVYSAAQLTPGASIYSTAVEERFIEEPIIAMDETLIQAVEKIIAQSGQSSNSSSKCSSRSTSRKGSSLRDGGRGRSNSDATKVPVVPEHHLEVPRTKCKEILLSALTTVAKDVEESKKRGEDSVMERTENHLREGVRNWLVNIETLD